MDNLYNIGKLCRAAYVEKKLLHGVDRKHGQGMPEEIIQQEVNSKRKQDEIKREVKVVVMKGDTTFTYVLACSICDTNPVHIISTVSDNVKWTHTKKKFYSKIDKKTVDMVFNCLNDIHK